MGTSTTWFHSSRFLSSVLTNWILETLSAGAVKEPMRGSTSWLWFIPEHDLSWFIIVTSWNPGRIFYPEIRLDTVTYDSSALLFRG